MRITILQIGGIDFPVQPIITGAAITFVFGIIPFLQPFSVFGLGLILGSSVAMFWAFRNVEQPFRYFESFVIGSMTAFFGDLPLMFLILPSAIAKAGDQFNTNTVVGGALYLLSMELAKCMLIGGGTAMIIASVERKRWRKKV